MTGLKGFIQFLSIILCVFLLTFVSSADYEKDLLSLVEISNIYSEASDGTIEYSDYYNVTEGSDILSGTAETPSENINSLESKILNYIEGEKVYTELENSYILSFTGDCSLGVLNNKPLENSSFYKLLSESGSETYPFDNVRSLFENDHLTMINLEGTLTTAEKQASKYFRIKGEPAWAQTMIAASSIEACTIANNHSYDYLKEGYEETKQSLNEAGVLYTTDSKPIVTMAGDVEVVILSGNYVNDGEEIGLRSDKLTEQICKYIKQYKKPENIVIVVCHWGEELKSKPNSSQTESAHEFVKAGADLIIGHHPHVLQGVEEYGGKYIFYSLGNFAFAGNSSVTNLNKRSIIVRPRVALKDGKAKITGVNIVPCYTTSSGTITNNFQPIPLFDDEAQKVLDYLDSIAIE